MAEKFDFEAALKAVQSGQSITGKDGVLGPLVKQLSEAALEAELDSHLADTAGRNLAFPALLTSALRPLAAVELLTWAAAIPSNRGQRARRE